MHKKTRQNDAGNYVFSLKSAKLKGGIFQTFWKLHCLPVFFCVCVRDFKFWLLDYFIFPLTVQSFSKIGQH